MTYLLPTRLQNLQSVSNLKVKEVVLNRKECERSGNGMLV